MDVKKVFGNAASCEKLIFSNYIIYLALFSYHEYFLRKNFDR